MKTEPAAITGFIIALVAAVLTLLRTLNVDISDDTQNAIRVVVGVISPLVAGFVIRQFVYSPQSVREHVSRAEVAAKKGETAPPLPV